jgi:NAD(P)-dependent dehydrogenase (short-subunit alcohol dehydrogenase family)
LTSSSLEQWDETVDINLKAGMRLSKLALPYLDASIKAKRLGAIINISSKSGKHYFGSLVPCTS